MKSLSRAVAAAALAVTAFTAPAHAATTVAPGAYTNTDAPGAQFAVLGNLGNSPFTFQFVVSAAELGGIASGSQITALGFRFAGSPFLDPQGVASYSNYSIQIGRATNAPTALSSNFAANMGADTITARSGAMTIPAGSFVDLPGDGPNNFFDLSFTTPYTYTGGNLAVLLRYTPTAGSPGIGVDAFAADSRIGTVGAFGNANATTGTEVPNTHFAPVVRFTFANVNAVPEPATWAMMIVGFGLIGAGLRRRATATFAAA